MDEYIDLSEEEPRYEPKRMGPTGIDWIPIVGFFAYYYKRLCTSHEEYTIADLIDDLKSQVVFDLYHISMSTVLYLVADKYL